jgi:hypothetical protein
VNDPVEFIRTPGVRDAVRMMRAGWDGAGWYFWDEEDRLHGPYLSKKEAEMMLEGHCESL